MTPFGVLFGVNHEAYITITEGVTKVSGASLGVFGFVMAGFLIIGFKNKVIGAFKNDPLKTFSYMGFTIAVIMYFISLQLVLIFGASIVGCTLSSYIEPVADVYHMACYKTDGDKTIKIKTKNLTIRTAIRQAYKGVEV